MDLTSNLLLLQRITDALRLSTLSPQCDIYVGNKDLYDRDGFYVGDTYYMIGSQQGWREMSKDQTGNRPKNKPPSGETIRVRLMYSKPPSILLNNHQRILDTVTALKGQIGGCVWAGRRLHLHSMREYIEPRGYFVECCWSSPPCGPSGECGECGPPEEEKARGGD